MHFDQVEMSDEQDEQTNPKETDFTFQHFCWLSCCKAASHCQEGERYRMVVFFFFSFFKDKIEKVFWFSTQ